MDQKTQAIFGLSRFLSRRRLDAESLRDALLQASGSLDRTIVQLILFRHSPSGSSHSIIHSRRTTTQRSDERLHDDSTNPKGPILGHVRWRRCCVEHTATPYHTTPIQALYFLMIRSFTNEPKEMEERLRPLDRTESERIQRVYWILLGREATSEDLQDGMEFLQNVRTLNETHRRRTEQL